MKKNKPEQPLEEMYKRLKSLSGKKSLSQVFDDFLSLSVCALQPGNILATYRCDPETEKLFSDIKSKYSAKDMSIFSECFGYLLMHAHQNHYKDPFGKFFEDNLSSSHTGQFFTPESVCEMMAQMTIPHGTSGKRILDPSVGSGRNLLAAAKIAPENLFFGADIDLTCVHMTLLNMCIYKMSGEVAWMNSLTNVIWKVWRVNFPVGIEPITPENSYFHQSISHADTKQDANPTPNKQAENPPKPQPNEKPKPLQLQLF
jgi:type I restriction-modification system DNA methylase subunit